MAMKSVVMAAIAAVGLNAAKVRSAPHAVELAERDSGPTISSCGSAWMAIADVTTNFGQIQRRGYLTAMNEFCALADGQTVDAGGYLSLATRVFLDGGQDPTTYGFPGYVYFEVHNKQSSGSHQVVEADCKSYLQELSNENSKCWGSQHNDTKGGTYQINSGQISYHALGEPVLPAQDAVDKLFTGSPLSTLSGNGSAALSPFPMNITYDTTPVFCHSHNDYVQSIPLYNALTAGCISVEADVWLESGQLLVSHDSPSSNAPTIQDLYINPLIDLLNTQNPDGVSDGSWKGVFETNSSQSLVLLVDFKSDGDTTWPAVIQALQPLRDADYLSHWDGTNFVQRPITAVASGNAPLADAASDATNSGHYMFMDARVNEDMTDFNTTNTYYTSADFESAVTSSGSSPMSSSDLATMQSQIAAGHAKGFLVRYYDIPSTDIWQEMFDNGVDRINVDNMYDLSGMNWHLPG